MTDPKRPAIGQKAPAFRLPAYPEGKISLKDYAGEKNVVLYFYPRDNTPGCTKEACNFRDALPQLVSAETTVLGVSADPFEAHQKFAADFSLPFPLLIDEDHAICEKYGVWVEKNMYGKKSMGIQRATFLIDKAGKIAAIWPRVKVDGHVEQVLAAIEQIST